MPGPSGPGGLRWGQRRRPGRTTLVPHPPSRLGNVSSWIGLAILRGDALHAGQSPAAAEGGLMNAEPFRRVAGDHLTTTIAAMSYNWRDYCTLS